MDFVHESNVDMTHEQLDNRDEDGFIVLKYRQLIPKSDKAKAIYKRTQANEIILRHGHIAITNYKMGDNREFEKSLCSFDKVNWRYIPLGYYYVKDFKELRINRGYDLRILTRYFPNYKIRIENVAIKPHKIDIDLYTAPRDDFQKVALTFMTSQGMYESNGKYTQQLIDAQTGLGKSQPDDTLIRTPNGWIPLGHLQVGDLVSNQYNMGVKILAIYPQKGFQKTYKITLRDGDNLISTRCNDDHLWKVYTETDDSYVIPLKLIRTSEYKKLRIPVYAPALMDHKLCYIDSIEEVKATTQRCILIDDPDHLYITENNIITHNTYCGIASVAYWKHKAIIIVPFSKLLSQWKDAITDYTNITDSEVMIVQGSDACKKIINGECKDIKVFIFMVDTIASFHDTYGDLETIKLFEKTHAYVKIVDEVHRDLKALSMIEALSNFHMNYYMSASPGRSEKKENWMFKRLFKNIPTFGGDFQTNQEKHITVMIKKYRWTPDVMQTKRIINPKTGMNIKAYEKELINSPEWQRQDFDDSLRVILNWGKKIMAKDKRLMILAQSIDTLFYLQKITEEVFPGETGVYYGGLKPKEKEAALEKRIIIATDSTLGTGANIPNLQLLIYASTYSNWLTARQISGRLRKLSDGTPVCYIELVNFGWMKTARQFDNRKSELLNRSKTGKLLFVN